MQRSLGYDPHPPFECMVYDLLNAVSAAARAGSSPAALLIATGPRRHTRLNR